MKKLLILAIILFASTSYAGEYEDFTKKVEKKWSLTPIFGAYVATGSESIFQNGFTYGIKGKYKAVVLKIQRIESSVRYVGQRGIDLNFNTVMVGFEHEFKPTDFGVFAIGFSGGIAVPEYEEGYQYFPTTHSEGLWRHTNIEASFGSSCKSNIGRPYLFDKYKVDYSTAPIIELDLNYTKDFKYGAFFMSAGYTYLSVEENIRAIDEPNINGGWSIIDNFDCSGASFMVGYKIRF